MQSCCTFRSKNKSFSRKWKFVILHSALASHLLVFVAAFVLQSHFNVRFTRSAAVHNAYTLIFYLCACFSTTASFKNTKKKEKTNDRDKYVVVCRRNVARLLNLFHSNRKKRDAFRMHFLLRLMLSDIARQNMDGKTFDIPRRNNIVSSR